MIVSSFIGVYEGMVPMIIFIVPLAISLGWDSPHAGLGDRFFTAAPCWLRIRRHQPFTMAVARRLAVLPSSRGRPFGWSSL
ncbi:hypothetical protein MASR2M78_35290 [Treponema sp.]